jgi:RimJ/RimL family protein N-acetyltransferase
MATVESRPVELRSGRQIVVRSAGPDDADALVELYHEVVAEGRWTQAQAGERALSATDEAAEVERLHRDVGSLYLIACEGERLLGTARAEGGGFRRTAHFADVHSVWVRGSRRRAGVADALLGVLVDWARDCPQLEKLGLFVFSTSDAAIALYRKHGFVEEGRGRRDMKFEDDSYADTVIMARFLGAGDNDDR